MSPSKASSAAAQLATTLSQTPALASTSSLGPKSVAEVQPDQAGKSKSKKKRGGNKPMVQDSLALHTISEGRMTHLPVVFTQDADYFFCVSKTTIRIFSRTTGQVVSVLSTGRGAHFAPITSIFISPSNPLQLLTSSLDGHVKVWDFLDGILLRSFDLGLPITGMCAHSTLPNLAIVSLKKPRHRDSESAPKSINQILGALDDGGTFNSIIGSFDLTATSHGLTSLPNFSKGASIRPKLLRIGKTREAVALEISPNGKWLVVVGNDKVQVAQTEKLDAGFTKFISSHPAARKGVQESMKCMAFHPTDPTRIVTGDSVGRIRMWYCLQDTFMAPTNSESEEGLERHAPSTVMHWHAHAVSSLAFSPNGAHLLSGGEEGVLVVWHLHASGGAGAQKEFVPRLGAPISSIAVANGLDGREQEYAVALADGSITFVSSMTLKSSRTFSRFKIDASRHQLGADPTNSEYVPLAVHPTTGSIVLMAGHPSSLQFYDPLRDATAMELEIAPSNRVSRADEDHIEPTRVERVAFSPSTSVKTGEKGEWMVTFDSRNLSGDVEVISESSLKFWRWDSMNHRYVLNTRIDRPHNGKRLTSITFSPVTYLLVTTADDAKARSWHLGSRTLKSGRKESYWACRSVFSFRDQIPVCSSFSADGSILALGQRGSVTLWSPETNVQSMAITAPELEDGVSSIAFSGRFLSIACKASVIVWDLILSRQAQHLSLDAGQHCRLLLPCPGGQKGRFFVVSSTDNADAITSGKCTRDQKTVVQVISIASSGKDGSQQGEQYTCHASINTVAPMPSSTGDVPELIALTQDMDLVHLTPANANGLPTSETSAAASIRGISNVRKTLFDDLFGPSTFRAVDDEDVESRVASDAAVGAAPSGITSLFSTASHLLPPATAMFESFISKLLRAPSVSAKTSAPVQISRSQAKDEAANGYDDPTSIVSEKTMDDILLADNEDLVALFRDKILIQPVTEAPAPVRPPVKSTPNGVPKVPFPNGKVPSTPSAVPSTPSKSPRKRKP